MKRLLIFIFTIIALLLASAIILPFAYKGKISEIALKKVNELVDAKITYKSYQLTLYKSFPDFTATFNDLSIVGIDHFENDTLMAFRKLSARINIMSIIRKSDVLIKSIVFDDGIMNLIVSEDEKYNWEIKKTNELNDSLETVAAQNQNNSLDDTNSHALKLLLNSIVIKDFDFIYNNKHSDYTFAVYGVDAEISGQSEGMNSVLAIKAGSPSLNYKYHEIYYLQNNKVDLSTRLEADLNNFDFKFETGSSEINGVPVELSGGFAMPGDSMLFDIHFDVPNIGMNNVLSLIPASYQKYLSDIKTDGTIKLNGAIQGLFYNEIYPAINIDFDITNGWLKYPQLPDELKIHRLKAQVLKPEGDFDLIQLGISQFDMQLAENPLSMHALFSNLMSDPLLDVSVNGVINLETLSKVVPLGDTKLTGLLTADIKVNGNYSALENNNFKEFISSGNVTLNKFYVQNSSVPQGANISKAALVLHNQDITINGLQGKMGRSDFQLSGELNNVITYLFANDLLKGRLKLQSTLFDVNEFMAAYQPDAEVKNKAYIKVDSTKIVSKPLELPKNIHLVFDAAVSQLLFDQMNITNFNGNIELHNQQLTLNGLTMDMIGGKMNLSGKVIADGRKNPDLNVNLDIFNFDLPQAYRQISMVQKYMPFAAKSQGQFSSKLRLQAPIDNKLKTILTDISAKGTFSTHNLKLVDAVFFSNLKSVIQYEKLRNLQIDDFKTGFIIKNGNLDIDPLKTKLANQPVQLSGSYNLGGTLNFKVDATIEKQLLSSEIQSMIAYVPGHERIKTIDVGLLIKGDAKKPEVTVDNDKIRKQVMDQLKTTSPKELEDAARKLLQGLFK